MKLVFLPLLLALAGCATNDAAMDGPGMDLAGAEVVVRTEANGDVIEEYRVGTQIRMVKVTPSRGAPYYLYDRNADGRMDDRRGDVSPVYWKLYDW